MRDAYAMLLDLEPDLELSGVAESAEAFLDALPETECDLVVTDLSLPGMDGIELLKRLQEIRPGLPAIVISAHEEPGYQKSAERVGARAYLTKRDLAATLGPGIREALERAA